MFQKEKPDITFVRPVDEQVTNNHSAKPSRFDEVSKDLTASFGDLNDDCLVNILSCLSSEDMNSAAICSKRCLIHSIKLVQVRLCVLKTLHSRVFATLLSDKSGMKSFRVIERV